MKPNLKFLQKVADGYVAAFFAYSAKRGGRYGFRGGEVTANKHAKAGFVNMPTRSPSMGMPANVTLTDAGRAALAQSQHQRGTENV